MADQVIQLTKTIFERGAIGIEQVEQSLGRKAVLDQTVSNDSFNVFHFADAGLAPMRSIEVRVRRSTGRSKIYVIELDTAKHCLKARDIRAEFGPPQELAPPPARHAGKVPAYFVYKYKQGELRFGMATSGAECCVNVVVEFNQ